VVDAADALVVVKVGVGGRVTSRVLDHVLHPEVALARWHDEIQISFRSLFVNLVALL
jgi:hypothetical protein